MGTFPFVTIKTFRGLNKSVDVLSTVSGQLIKNENYLYGVNGELYERGGGAKLTNNPSGAGNDPLFSLSNYIAPDGTNYLITNQDATVYYYSSGWNDLSMSLTADKKVRWENAGFEANRALYGVNGTDSVIKVAGNTPVGSTVSNSPTDCIDLKLHKNRLFGINNKDTLYFTEVLDFDTWNTTVNTIEIAPGIDGDLYGIEVWGDALFLFKEFGVYVLPNADSPVPNENWVILRTDASVGTQSTDTVRRTKDGIYYLSTDNFVRTVGPTVTFSSGEYTLAESGSPVISEDITDDVNTILDVVNKDDASAIFFKDQYVLSFKSKNNTNDYNDVTYFADTAKFNQYANIAKSQPYWGQFTGFDYNFYAVQISGGQEILYGAKGLSGHVHETLNDSIHNDDGAAIVSHARLGWTPLGGEGLYKRIRQVYFSGDTENWDINLVFNAYRLDSELPGEGEGVSKIYSTTSVDGGGVGTAIVGTSLVGFTGVSSKMYTMNLTGHYFTAEFKNSGVDEFNRIIKLIVYFKPIKQS